MLTRAKTITAPAHDPAVHAARLHSISPVTITGIFPVNESAPGVFFAGPAISVLALTRAGTQPFQNLFALKEPIYEGKS
jgi:hypothetical protein